MQEKSFLSMIYDGAANRITRPPRIARWPSGPLALFYITLNYLLTERILHYAKLSSTLFPKLIDPSGILHKKALLEITPKSTDSSGILHKKALADPIPISIPIPKPVSIKGTIGNDT